MDSLFELTPLHDGSKKEALCVISDAFIEEERNQQQLKFRLVNEMNRE